MQLLWLLILIFNATIIAPNKMVSLTIEKWEISPISDEQPGFQQCNRAELNEIYRKAGSYFNRLFHENRNDLEY